MCGSQVALIVAVPPVTGGGDSESTSTCVVPDVTGRLVDDIRKPLAQLKLGIGRITTRESDRPRGFVLAQSPTSGTKVACGSQIAVLVAIPVDHGDTQQPPPACVVPDLGGTDVGELQRRLARANLIPGSVSDRPVDVRQGTIVSQQPRPGAQVKCRSQVDVWVAVPPTVTCSAVPQLIGRDAKAAAATLQRGGLRLGTVDERESNEDPGVVVDQAPPVGFNVKCDTPVRIWVAVPPTLVIVPMLRGNNEAGARSTLERTGLVMGQVAQRPSDQPVGAVVEQSPTAGTMVKRGSPVQVWLAQPQPTTVPDLRGQDRATATNTLTTARLRLGETADRPSERTAGYSRRADASARHRCPSRHVRASLARGSAAGDSARCSRHGSLEGIRHVDGSTSAARRDGRLSIRTHGRHDCGADAGSRHRRSPRQSGARVAGGRAADNGTGCARDGSRESR